MTVPRARTFRISELAAKGLTEAAIRRKWEATPKGIEEAVIKLKMKAIEKRMTAVKLAVDVANTKARNLY